MEDDTASNRPVRCSSETRPSVAIYVDGAVSIVR